MTPFRLRAFAFFGVLFGIWMPHFSELNYGFGSFESLFFTGMSALVAVALGYVCRNILSFGVALGILIYALIDIYFVDLRWAQSHFILLIGLIPLLLRYMPMGLPLAIFLFGLIFGGPSFFTPTKPLFETREPNLPVALAGRTQQKYLHIILDEQMSPTASHPAIPPIQARQKIIDTYVDNGFRLYAHADAIGFHTYESLSAIFGLSAATSNYTTEPDGAKYDHRVIDNELLDRLLENGFAPTVVETDYLGLCGDDPRIICQTYRAANDMQGAASLGWQPLRRIGLAMLALRNDYLFGARQLFALHVSIVGTATLRNSPVRRHTYFMQPVNNLAMLDALSEKVAEMQPGDAYIYHLLIPHFPYVVDQDCSLLDAASWGLPPRYDRGTTIRTAYSAFWDQSVCTHTKLEAIFAAAAKHDDLTIVVHGDHGSRILDETDFRSDIDELATMIAIKSSSTDGELISATVALQSVFEQFFDDAMQQPNR